MISLNRLLLVALLGCLLSGSVAWGQQQPEEVTTDLYGRGVHQYFSGRYDEAKRSLALAIQAGSTDPRVYYFLGLIHLNEGQRDKALQDFQEGANLEAADKNLSMDINRSLTRVQGSQRVLLEKYRSEAQVRAVDRFEEMMKRRYETLTQREEEVLKFDVRERAGPTSPETVFADEPGDVLPALPKKDLPEIDTSEPIVSTPPAKEPTEETKPEMKEPAEEPAETTAEVADPIDDFPGDFVPKLGGGTTPTPAPPAEEPKQEEPKQEDKPFKPDLPAIDLDLDLDP